MPLAAATRLGPYEIVAPLGAGGMGEVYRARDTRLGREVAIKVLPATLTASPEIRARFEREARTVSSLNHPNICTLHDVGRDGDTDYLVMELIEGETLAQRLTKGALPTAEVLRLGAQIADALDRAHRAGVIHRDLKPGNVMLTKSGAKLMDFGLARATGLAGPAGGAGGSGVTLAGLSQSPTRAAPLTAEGTIVGTFQYMAPEQLEGKEADARSDLWALGCVLYEMTTGRRAFEGKSQASLIGAIMHHEPAPLSQLAPMTPPALDRLVRQCLAKDPDERIQSAHDVKLQLAGLAEGGSTMSGTAVAAAPRRPKPAALVPWAVAALATIAAVVALVLPRTRGPAETGVMRFSVAPPEHVTLDTAPAQSVISPDGRKLVYAGADSSGAVRLWVRPIESLASQPLEGTDNGFFPFWSPDSRFIGFFADGKLKKVPAEGGAAEVLCDAADGRGATWGRKGVIVFAPIATGPLMRVADEGGEPVVIARADSTRHETALRFPSFLPDGKHFTYVSLPGTRGNLDVYVGSTDGRTSRRLTTSAAAPVVAEPGYMILVRNGRLLAQRFDSRGLKLSGSPVAIGVPPPLTSAGGTPAVSVSRNGILARPSAGLQNTRLVWVDRGGRPQGEVALPPARYEWITVSPDGKRAVVQRRSEPNSNDLWMVDLERSLVTRFTFMPSSIASNQSWSPDGRWVAFNCNVSGPYNIYRKAANGQGDEELLYESSTPYKNITGWTPDGRNLLFDQPDPATGWDSWMLPVDGDRKPVPLLKTRFNESNASVSPDGRWVAFVSEESGRLEVYVQAFPTPEGKHQISTNGAGFCDWSRDGKELVLGSFDFTLWAVDIETTPTFRASKPRAMFRLPNNAVGLGRADSRRFIEVLPIGETARSTITLELNWIAAMKKR